MTVHRACTRDFLLLAVLTALPTLTLAAGDQFPKGCVSCHTVDEAKGADHRLSVALGEWTAGKVGASLLAKSKASAPSGFTPKGKHPAAEDSLEDIPSACLDCHESGSMKAPPFSRLMHLVHLTGGTDNVFVSTFKGDCTHCHKLDASTGAWSLPSSPEQ
jgi:cytochrome c553